MTLPDGLYFGLDDSTYHSEPRLSASGIKNLLVSPMNFWCDSWLNPNRRSDDDDDQPEWKEKGRAYHRRVCEGDAAFKATYAAQIEPSDVPGALVKLEDLKRECKRVGAPVSGTKDVLADRLRQFGCQLIWQDLEEAYAETHKGKTLIPKSWIHDIELAAACVENHSTLKNAFKSGFAEVAVLWHEEVERNDGSGEIITIPMKSKFDYFKPAAIVDFKSFQNKMRKPIDRAVYYDIAVNKYHIQCSVYYQAGDRAAQFIKDGKVTVVSGEAPSAEWLAATAATDKTFLFVHQQKGFAPVAVGNIMPREMGLVYVGNAQVREAQQLFDDCMKKFGALPWIMDRPIQMLADNDIPMFASE